MRYVLRLVYILVFIITYFTVDAQWENVYPAQGTTCDLVTAVIPRNTTLQYAIGNDVVTSPDQGASWSVQHRHTLPNQVSEGMRYYDVTFSSANTGYLTYQNKIYKTTDGGGVWSTVLELTPTHAKYQSSAYFQALSFTDDLNGYAVGDFKKIFKTTDGGITWETLSRDNSTAPFTSYTGVQFLDAQRGYVVGYQVSDILMNFGFEPFMLSTTDGGVTWDRYEIPTHGDYRKMSVQFVNETTGFVHGTTSQSRDAIFVTHNGGATWAPGGPSALSEIRCMYWLDEHTGFASGDDDVYEAASFRTFDGGAHWEAMDISAGNFVPAGVIQGIRFSDSQHGFAVGLGGYITTTQDGGNSWSVRSSFHPMYTGLAHDGGSDLYGSTGFGLYRSADSGASWHFDTSIDPVVIKSIHVTAPGEGYFYGYSNYIYRFTEGATNIDEITVPVRFLYAHELISTNDSLYLAGATIVPSNSNVFLKSGDGGQTWTTHTIADGTHAVVAFYKFGDVFLIATTGAVYRSADGGKSWKKLSDFGSNTITSLCFLNNTTAVCATAAGEVRRSGDGGVTWTDATGPFPEDNNLLWGFLPASTHTVYVFGSKNMYNGIYGALWESTDGGKTWHEETLPGRIDRTFSAMTMDDEYVYATGGNGQVMRKKKITEEPQDPTPVEPGAGEQALTLYPVPAYEKLNLSLPGTTPEISIYNIHGIRQPATVEKAEDGLYAIALQHIAPGVYVLEVVQGNRRKRARFIKQ
jgi:photosystem II stability/assembly factor-like uncharacterized protein